MEYGKEVEEILGRCGLTVDPHAAEDFMYQHTTKRAPMNLSDETGPRWIFKLYQGPTLAGVGCAKRRDDALRAAVADLLAASGR